ncbi:succinate dehydrogenase cytochrome b subunit [Fluviispira sanaruensis]|uniref:Cytochrome B subunit n=1 Tax=Fluviispira sanaruensis TaxID=2493639 RepID=A0A4P2VPR5_FLUSA|nr:succinate dehydrogenase cytochrome b subunit [Fluviispira sanaruensis]BBH54240.1 cytochrome B subunit [Fluviispira sanaruensis]
MSANSSFLTSTIGKKYLMALTAIVWSLFVMVHMIGNMLIVVGAEAYNNYSHALTSNPIIYLIEAFLVAVLLFHAVTGLTLVVRNSRTKPKFYAVTPMREKSASIASRTMIYTGTATLAFVIWHLITFKFGPEYFVTYNGIEMRDIYKLVIEKFHEPLYVAGYGLVMILIGLHLYHGVQSIFQTLGLSHPRYNKFFKIFGYTYAVVVAAGFISQPLFVYFAR